MKRVVIVGCGPAGVSSALGLNSLGYEVFIVDKNVYAGGIVNLLDKQFPTNSCGFCRMIPNFGSIDIEEYCLKRGVGNVNFIRGYSVERIDGQYPEFVVRLVRKPPYVDIGRCIGCGKCESVCPVASEFFEFRSAIHRATKISSLNEYVIDRTCNFCGECVKVCPTDAIVLDRADERSIECNAIVYAGGLDEVSLHENCQSFGYGRWKNVITSLELERILSLYEGKLLRPSDSNSPSRVAFVQCVGSRDVNNPYCSSSCCMFTLKEIRMIKEKNPDVKISVFFMDMRAFGKGYWKYYREIDGVNFIRFRVASVEEVEDAGLVVRYESDDGKGCEDKFDLVVLAVGQKPKAETIDFARTSSLELDEFGYIRRRDLFSHETTRDGIFVVGNAVEPKDISDSVVDGLAVVSEVAMKVGVAKGKNISDLPDDAYGAIVYLCECNGEITSKLDFEKLEQDLRSNFPDIVKIVRISKLCNPDGLEHLRSSLAGTSPEFILIAACQGYYFASLFRDVIESGLGYLPRIRIVDLKTTKFGNENVSAVLSANLKLLFSSAKGSIRFTPQKKSVLVVGGGVSGVSAALMLAKAGVDVVLVEREGSLGGETLRRGGIYAGVDIAPYISKMVEELTSYPNVRVLFNTTVESIEGALGDFRVKFNDGSFGRFISVVVAVGAKERKPKIVEQMRGKILINTEISSILNDPVNIPSRIGFVQCVECLDEKRQYCSRFCCRKTVEAAKRILALKPETQIFIFFREMMTYGASELSYRELREKGVTFIRYSENNPLYFVHNGDLFDIYGERVKESSYKVNGGLGIAIYDPLVGRELFFDLDLIVVASGVDPAELSFVPVNRDSFGFLSGLDVKFSPLETEKSGLIVAGSVRLPMNFYEAYNDGKAASAQVLAYVNGLSYISRGARAYVSERKCVRCLLCVSVCPYGARYFDDEKGIVIVDDLLCRGCGVCAVSCPSQATDILGFSARALMGAIDDLAS